MHRLTSLRIPTYIFDNRQNIKGILHSSITFLFCHLRYRHWDPCTIIRNLHCSCLSLQSASHTGPHFAPIIFVPEQTRHGWTRTKWRSLSMVYFASNLFRLAVVMQVQKRFHSWKRSATAWKSPRTVRICSDRVVIKSWYSHRRAQIMHCMGNSTPVWAWGIIMIVYFNKVNFFWQLIDDTINF